MTFSKFQTPIYLIFGTLVWFIAIPILILIYFPMFIYKHIFVKLCLLILKPNYSFLPSNDCVVTLTTNDAKRRPFIFCESFYLQEYLSLEDIKHYFTKCFLDKNTNSGTYDSFFFTFSQFMGYTIKTSLKSTEYSFDKHFHEINIKQVTPKNIDQLSNEKINDILAEYFLSRISRFTECTDQPLWDVFVIQSNSQNPKTIILIQLDHLVMDGFSEVQFLHKLAGNVEQQVKEVKDTPSLLNKVFAILMFPIVGVQRYRKTNPSLEHFINTNHPGGQPHVNTRIFASFSIETKLIKNTRQKLNVRFAPVLQGIIASGLKSFLLDKYSNLNLSKPFPKYLSIASPLPWSTHPSTVPHKPRLCNHFSYGVFPIKTSTVPQTTIQHAEMEHQLYETSLLRWGVKNIVYAFNSLHPTFLSTKMVDLKLPWLRADCFVSPIIFPQTEYFGSTKIQQLAFSFIDNGWNKHAGLQVIPITQGNITRIHLNASIRIFESRDEAIYFLETYVKKVLEAGLCQPEETDLTNISIV